MKTTPFKCLGIGLAVIAFIALFPWLVQLLWNGVLQQVVPVKPITYWQAFGLLILSKILFGGFPGGGGCRERCGSRRGSCDDDGSTETARCRHELRRRFGKPDQSDNDRDS